MRAATIVDGDVVVREHPDPVPGAGEVLVRVGAAGINAADILQRAGRYPAPPGAPPDIPGLELSGEVVGVGPNAVRFAPGDRVMAVVGGGGQAELCAVHERLAMPVPAGMDDEASGGFPEAFTTAHDALFTQCGLAMGERVLVSGAAGGVGSAAVQLAIAAGAGVTASVRREAMRGAVAALGARVLDPADVDGSGPYDVVLHGGARAAPVPTRCRDGPGGRHLPARRGDRGLRAVHGRGQVRQGRAHDAAPVTTRLPSR